MKKHSCLCGILQNCSAPLRTEALLTLRGSIQRNSDLWHPCHLQSEFSSQTLQFGLGSQLCLGVHIREEEKQQFSRESRSVLC